MTVQFHKMSETIGSRLQAWRRSLRLTQQELATKLGMERGSYKNYETGMAYPPQRIMKALVGLGFDPAGAQKGGPVEDPWQIRATPRQVRLLIEILYDKGTPDHIRETAKDDLLHALGISA